MTLERIYGACEVADIELARDLPKKLRRQRTTRGFIASQAFVDHYAKDVRELRTLLPAKASQGLGFTLTHCPRARWRLILAVFDVGRTR